MNSLVSATSATDQGCGVKAEISGWKITLAQPVKMALFAAALDLF